MIDSLNVVTRCRLAVLAAQPEGHLFRQLLEMVKFYVGFEIDDFSGEQLTDDHMVDQHYQRVRTLQVIVYRHFDELKEFALSNVSSIDRDEVGLATSARLGFGFGMGCAALTLGC